MAAEPTVRDALIAEMLGDIGRLHDSVASLKTFLPGQIEEVEEKITGLIGLLMKAGDTYKAQLEDYTNTQGDKVRVQLETDLLKVKAQLAQDSTNAIKHLLADVGQTTKSTIQREVGVPAAQLVAAQQQGIRRTILVCVISSVLAASFTMMGNHFLFQKPANSEQEKLMGYGRATAAAWEKLDKKAQNIIKQEAERSQ